MEENFLFGKYRILKLLTNGSGGEVYLAEHAALSEKRILKCIHKNRPFFEERKKEVQVLKKLHHTSIPAIYDIEEDENTLYIIEQYMEGETLRDLLERKSFFSQPLILSLSIQLCEIMEYLHRSGFLYLDIKPENLILHEEKLSLIDFGAAQKKEDDQKVLFGTKGYASPEQLLGKPEQRSDIYGIGKVMEQMLKKNENASKKLLGLVFSCLRESPERRVSSVSKLKDELYRLCPENAKRKQKNGKKLPLYIGVAGVHEGSDTLAVCIQTACYLKELGIKHIACIELSDDEKRRALFEGCYGKRKEIPEEFVCGGITFLSGQTVNSAGCAAKGYTVVISDYGYPYDGWQEELYRCDLPMAVGDTYPWHQGHWLLLQRLLEEHFLKNQLIALVSAGECGELPIQTGKRFRFGEIRDVFHPEKGVERLLKQIFKSTFK